MAYIKKESIIEFITKGLNNPDKSKAFGYDAIEILTEIEYTPAADVVEVRHGEWIYDHWCEFRCSICGHWSKTEPRGKEKFCPNCGAKMDGGKF